MRGNNNRNSRRRELLVEYYGQGTFKIFLDRAKQGLASYGEVLTNSFGVVFGDSLYLAKLTFSPLKSGSTYDKWSRENNSRRQKQLSAIRTNSDKLLEGGTDIALLLCPIAPHLMLTDKILRSASLQDESVNSFLEKTGLNTVPGVAGLYNILNGEDWSDKSVDWSDDSSIREYHERLFGDLQKNDNEKGIIGKAWDITQRVFLLDFSESSKPSGKVLQEEEENEDNEETDTKTQDSDVLSLANVDIPEDIESDEDYYGWLFGSALKDTVPDPEQYIEDRGQSIDKIIESTKSLLEAYCEIAVCKSVDELFEALSILNGRLDDKLDLEKIRKDVDTAALNATKKKEVYDEWIELDPKNEELDAAAQKKKFESYVKNGVLVTAKGKLVPQIRPMFEDTQDILKDQILEGATPELIEQFEKYPELQVLAQQMKNHLNKVKTTIEPILVKENL